MGDEDALDDEDFVDVAASSADICRRTVGLGAGGDVAIFSCDTFRLTSFSLPVAEGAEVATVAEDNFCFSSSSVMDLTSARVESSWCLSSWFDPVETRLSCELLILSLSESCLSRASIDGLTGIRLRGAMA